MARKRDDLFLEIDDADSLVVIVHGFNGKPENFRKMREAIRRNDRFRTADFLIPAMPFGVGSFGSPYTPLARLFKLVDDTCAAHRYRHIYLIGFSMGGIFARRLFTLALGERADAPSEPALLEALADHGIDHGPQPRPWAADVERVVLLAALNRGWSINHSLGMVSALQWWLAVVIGRLIGAFGGDPMAFSVRKGSVFVTQMRIQWIRMREDLRRLGAKRATCVQLLGSVDDIVGPEDSVDLVAGQDFFYLDVPHTNHRTMSDVLDEDQYAPVRGDALRLALTASEEALGEASVLPADETFTPDRDVEKVVFVIHGIRDKGYWTHKIARRVRTTHARETGTPGAVRIIATETSSYGYFPAFSFIFKGRRRKKATWLMDEYTEAMARYPNAEFSFVGHSNGTYLLAWALRNYRAARFVNIVFAGSVVRRSYRWDLLADDQYSKVLNYVATRDLVLAFLTKPLQRIRFFDVGAAGHDGFDQAGAHNVHQLGPVKGGHAAAIAEDQWDDIAHFILNGDVRQAPAERLAGRRNPLAVAVGVLSPLIVLAGALVLAAAIAGIAGSSWGEWERATSIIGLTWLLLLVARKA